MTAMAPLLFLLQLAAQDAPLPASMLGMLINSDPVTKSVLVLLAVLSLLSWSIMFSKWRGFAAAEANGRAFVADFERARGIPLHPH